MIYTKLAQIQSAVKGLTKNQQGFNYQYVDGNKCLGSIRPMMVELGVLLSPEVTDIENKPITYQKWNNQSKCLVPVTEVLTTLKMRMNWIDTEDGSTFSQEWSATGMNGFDKGFGSALTYGERYYLLKFFHIPTDKDDVDYLATTRDAEIEKAQLAAPSTQQQIVQTLQSRINQMQQPAAPQQGAFKPWPSKATYDAMVKAAAERKVKNGMPIFDYFRVTYGPTPEQQQTFLDAVDYYRVNNNL